MVVAFVLEASRGSSEVRDRLSGFLVLDKYVMNFPKVMVRR